MTQGAVLAVVFAISAGLIIELFFRLVKYRDQLNKVGPRGIITYNTITDASNYMSVSQYLSGGERRWFNYFLFRLLPPALIITLLAAIIDRYFITLSNLPYLLIAAIVSLIPRDVVSLFTVRRMSEQLLHITNIILVVALVPFIAWVSTAIDISFIAPTPQGLIDNLWSSLTIAILVLLYLQVTNMGTRYQDETAEDTALSNHIVKAYTHIRNKHDHTIQDVCMKYSCSRQILYAVLIYEDMNRPPILRKFENFIVRVFKIYLTVGIAQVRSNKPLTDEESIRHAAKILRGSSYADTGVGDGSSDIQQLETILHVYNSSKLYTESISRIITKLRVYAGVLFSSEQSG